MKHAGLVFSFIFLLLGCASSPIQQENNNSIRNALVLDSAITESSNYLASRINVNSKIAVVNIQSSTVNLSNYLIDSLLMHLVNKDKYLVIERAELNELEKELNYQLSGAVSDETAVSIGKQLGTQYIITGSVFSVGDNYSFRIKVLNVQTAQIVGTRMYTIKPDKVLISLLNQPVDNKDDNQKVHIDNFNITNNNTTTIHGDVYVNMPKGLGW